jgi:adenosylcobinamide-phosphate guanylyltransferase
VNTPETEKKCLQEGWRVIRTDGKGYHEDLKQAILAAPLACPVLIVSSDLPALTGKFLDKIIDAYEKSKTDALTVLVPVERRERLKLSVSSTYLYMGKSYAVSGINLVDGAKIQDEKLGECAVVTDEAEAVLNVNTLEDLGIAEELVKKQKLKRGFNAPN